MHSALFRSTFLRVLKFLQIKEGRHNFWGDLILLKVWIIWSPLLYFNFKSFLDPNWSSFIRFQCILHDSGVLFSESWNVYKLKKGDLISGGTNIAENLNYLFPPSVYFNFRSFMDPQFFSFIRSQCILLYSGVLFSESRNFYKLKSGGHNFWGDVILQKVWIIWSPLLYFNFKSFMDTNFWSFIRFQYILYDSVVLFSKSLNIYKLKSGDLISEGNQFCRKSELFPPPLCISILKVF